MKDDILSLVPFTLSYFEYSKKWLSDKELSFLIHAGELPSDEERMRWFKSLPFRTDYLIWGVEYMGRPIGVSGLKNISEGQAEYWGYIGEKELWGNGLGRVMVNEVVLKAKELSLSTVYLRVRKYNPRAYRMYLKYGFKIVNEDADIYNMSIPV